LDGRHVVFGAVEPDCESVLTQIETAGVISDGYPLQHSITITKSGIVGEGDDEAAALAE